MLQRTLITLVFVMSMSAVFAQDEAGDSGGAEAEKPPRYPCKESAQHRAFDYWVGTWDVLFNGEHAGVNQIELILGDCVLFENWTSAGGNFDGKSFNYYDSAEGHWRQIWLDDRGGVIEFTGQVRDGAMYYTATTNKRSDGSEVKHKLTFTPNEDGSVRQLWEQSGDGGENWQTVWDGHYVKKE